MPQSMPSQRTVAYVAWLMRYGKVLWAVALLLAVWAGWRTARLYGALRSDLELLLPQDAPSVVALQELRARIPGIQFLGVIIDAGKAENLPAAEKLVDDLSERIKTYPPELVRGVHKDISEERSFLEANAPLYAELADLKEVRKRIEDRRDWEVSRATGVELDDDEPCPPLDFSDIEKRYRAKDPSEGRFPNGRFSSTQEHATVLLVEISGYSTGIEQAQDILHRIRGDIEQLGGTNHYAPGMRYAFTGDPAIAVEELSALVTDLAFSTFVVIAAVIGVLLMYYRWWRAVPAIGIPLIISTCFAFAASTLPPFRVSELNSNTAFLGSIIVGNGINFAIIMLARYVEERRRGESVEQALALAVHGTRVGTVVAAAAAAIAYGSLVVTQFRGFWQFGVIGGLGMLICWATTFVLTPPLIAWLDRGPHTAPRALAPTRLTITGVVAKLVARYPYWVSAAGLALTLAAIVGSRHFGRERLETDFSKMRRIDTWQQGEGYWGRRMDAVLGRYLTPIEFLTDSPEQTRALAAALRELVAKPPMSELIESVRTVDDVIPQDQTAKLQEVKAIRKVLTPKIRAEIPEDKRPQVDKMLGDGGLHEIKPQELPRSFTAGLLDRDGSMQHAVLVYPRPSKEHWKGQVIMLMAKELRQVAARFPDAKGRVPRVAGRAPLSADITSSMERDGTLATVVAMGGVLALVLGAFRWSRQTLWVLGALLMGVLWLVFGTIVFDVKLNFANFIGFPITFGIGVDYAVNVMWRYRLDGNNDVLGAIRSTGGAVGLCSATTVIGYSSLLLAKNQALFSFGLVAVLGELTCLSAAVLILPALLLVADRKRAAF